jgi:acetyl-CoA synthetase
VGEERCYASLADLPETPDCVVVAVKRELVEDVISECVALGVGAAIVFASGYAEVRDEARKAEQRRLADAAQGGGLLLAGPNTNGSSNFVNGAVLTFSPEMALDAPTANAVGVVSQSGAVGYAAGQAMRRGVNLSHVLVCGNSADIDVADYVAYLAKDDDCAAIVCMVEGLDDPVRLVRAAELAREADKPLVMFKAGRGEVAAAATLSHTGSIAGSHQAYVAALENASAIFVEDHEALLDTAAFLAKAPPPRSGGVAVATASGGWGVILADQAEAAGVSLPPLPARAADRLAAIVPEFGSVANPCDVTAQILANRESFAATASALLDEDCYDALVWPQPWTIRRTAEAYEKMFATVGDVARARGKIACMVWSTQWLEGPGVASAERNGAVAVFRSARHCCNAIIAWKRLWADRAARAERRTVRLADAQAADAVRATLATSPTALIGERAAKQILAAYGVDVVEERVAADPGEAARAARDLGFPVVLKVDSPDLAHKSEAGGVRLNLRSAEEVEAAGAAALAAVARHAPAARIEGLLVQRQLRGTEILIGSKRDPQFGPLVAVGYGGVLAEVVADVVLRPAPVAIDQARAMIDELRCRAVLDGVRDLPRVEIDRLAEAVARVSELAAAHADQIAEIDVNPVICAGDQIVAADALIVRT